MSYGNQGRNDKKRVLLYSTLFVYCSCISFVYCFVYCSYKFIETETRLNVAATRFRLFFIPRKLTNRLLSTLYLSTFQRCLYIVGIFPDLICSVFLFLLGCARIVDYTRRNAPKIAPYFDFKLYGGKLPAFY